MKVVTTFVIAAIGGWLARRIKVPAGAMIGAIVSTALLNIFTEFTYVPSITKLVMQIAGGILLGHPISRGNLVMVKRLGKATIILISGLMLLNITLGILIHFICGMELSTSLFATAPGGVSDMALIADALGANTSIVSLMQLFRMFGIYLIFPPIIRLLTRKNRMNIEVNSTIVKQEEVAKSKRRLIAPRLPIQVEETGETSKKTRKTLIWKSRKDKGEIQADNSKNKNLPLTVLCGILGGVVLHILKVPAGGLVGSVLACSMYNIFTGKGYIPSRLRFPIQVGVGAIIGAQMTKESLVSFRTLVIPVFVMIIGLLVFTLLFGVLMNRTTKLDFSTCLLALTPGGIQETSLLAEELGCDTAIVIVMHTIRLVVVICIFPSLLSLLIGL
jgi:membrane AbrB-like protein